MLRRENGGSDGLYGVYDDDFGDDSDGDVVDVMMTIPL